MFGAIGVYVVAIRFDVRFRRSPVKDFKIPSSQYKKSKIMVDHLRVTETLVVDDLDGGKTRITSSPITISCPSDGIVFKNS